MPSPCQLCVCYFPLRAALLPGWVCDRAGREGDSNHSSLERNLGMPLQTSLMLTVAMAVRVALTSAPCVGRYHPESPFLSPNFNRRRCGPANVPQGTKRGKTVTQGLKATRGSMYSLAEGSISASRACAAVSAISGEDENLHPLCWCEGCAEKPAKVFIRYRN